MAAPVGEVPTNANAQCPGTASEQAGKASSCKGCPNTDACASAPKGPVGEVPSNANAHCPGTASDQAGKADGCKGCPNAAACASAPKGPDPDLEHIAARLSTVKHKVLVLSGKGGVGKSTFSAQLAFALAAQGKEVGLMDVDICGPSIPKMLGIEGEEIHQSNMGWSPVYVQDNLGVMSIQFMLQSPDEAVVWRGPRKNGLIKQFMKDVHWGDLDYLVIDTPPGTSDEHISIVQFLLASGSLDGALVVTTPQEVAVADVRKEINFCKKVKIPCLGVVENMSGLEQPLGQFKFLDRSGGEEKDVTAEVTAALQQLGPQWADLIARTEVFAPTAGGGEHMAKAMNVPFLGRVPLDPSLGRACENGKSAFEEDSGVISQAALKQIVDKVIQQCNPGAGGGCKK